jgi:phosphopentomutase
MEQTIEIADHDFNGLCFVNLVDFDALWGHRRNPQGYGEELEKFDEKLGQLLQAMREDDLLIITADHGNAEELLDENGEPKTAHTTNLVPCIFYDNTENKDKYELNRLKDAGLTNVAPTIANLLGFTDLPDSWRDSLIK